MKKHKRLLDKWLADFIEVICELSDKDFRLSVYSGQSTLFVPWDIFYTLRRRKIFEYATESKFYFFRFQHDGGDVLVKVNSDQSLNCGLRLTIEK